MNKLILGTVQFGLPYGVSNLAKKIPEKEECYRILDCAWEAGIRSLDLAEDYGTSINLIREYLEQRPSKKFRLLMKFKYRNPEELFSKSHNFLREFKLDSLDSMSFHSFSDSQIPELLDQSQELKKAGVLRKLGVSIYTKEELGTVSEMREIDIVQTPFNFLDNERQRSNELKAARRSGKEIHARSIFLQGLFLMDENKIPLKLRPLVEPLNAIKKLGKEYGLNINQLALRYALSSEFLDGILIGVESEEQLKMNISAAEGSFPADLRSALNAITVTQPDLLDPRKWN